MTSDRVYRPAFLVEQAINIMKKTSRIHFDPELFEIFINNLEAFINIKQTLKD